MKNQPTHVQFNFGKLIAPQCFSEIQYEKSLIEIPGKEFYSATFDFINKEDAEAFAANFPKYCNLKVSECTGSIKGTPFGTELKRWPTIWFRSTKYKVNGSTAEINESGIKKHNKIVEVLKSLGY